VLAFPNRSAAEVQQLQGKAAAKGVTGRTTAQEAKPEAARVAASGAASAASSAAERQVAPMIAPGVEWSQLRLGVPVEAGGVTLLLFFTSLGQARYAEITAEMTAEMTARDDARDCELTDVN
jgi:hypothetical protein